MMLTIDHLDLAPVMAQRAAELQAAYPSVQYISGRRTLEAQAQAMACQVVTNRKWIGETYLHAALLQTAVDFHPECKTVDSLTTLLTETLKGMSSEEQSHVSDHLTGHAVDLMPMEDSAGYLTHEGDAVHRWMINCPDTKTVLLREGGKVIWHWATKADATQDLMASRG